MFSRWWNNIKALGLVLLLIVCAFIGYFAIIAGVVVVIATALFYLIRILLYDNKDND